MLAGYMNRKRDGDQSIVFPRLLTVFMGHRSLWATAMMTLRRRRCQHRRKQHSATT